ncbi:MAG: hypothetical protein WC915_00290 [archaeon]|jgi:hypothetical protein
MIEIGWLAGFSMFGYGFFGAAESAIIWFLFVYGSARANATNPHEHTIEFLLPSVMLAFVLTFFGVPDILVGLVVMISFLISIKHYNNMPMKPWIITATRILILMFFNNQFGPWVGKILLYLLIIWGFVEGEIQIRKLKRAERKKAKESKK